MEMFFIANTSLPDERFGPALAGAYIYVPRDAYPGEDEPGTVKYRNTLVPIATERDFYPLFEPAPPVGRVSILDTWDGGGLRIVRTYPADPFSKQEAADVKKIEIDDRWNKAMNDGAPVTVNGISALVRYEMSDRNRYAAVYDVTAVPAPGLLVVSLTVVNGKTRFTIAGAIKLTQLLDQLLAHRNTGDMAWDQGYTDVEDMVAGPASAEDIAAYDIEALAWPLNEI